MTSKSIFDKKTPTRHNKSMTNLKDYFIGAWAIDRTITYVGDVTHATATGVATFIPQADGALLLAESGKLTLVETGVTVDFTRKYRYVFDDDGVAIYFQDDPTQNDGLYQSYSWDETSGRLTSRDKHLCVLDIYDAQFHMQDARTFWQNTVVTGPKKDYQIKTVFSKNA